MDSILPASEQKTITSSCKEKSDIKESRWTALFENLDTKPGVMKIDDLVFNTDMKIANGCNASEIFAGLFHNSRVAVKRVAKHVSKTEIEMANFLCLKNFQTKHLLQPIIVLGDSYFAYFASPLCEYSLMELIENKDFPERECLTASRRLEICQQFLIGLQELHSRGILHRDLKPNNILFDITNKLYIADFGASRKLDLAQTTLHCLLAGTFSWSSFEDVGGMQYKYNKESDIQVAGCLLHYILTDGQHPYQASTPYSRDPIGLSQNVRMGNFTLQCEERWSVQTQVISRMLSKSIEERPTVEECLHSFTRVKHQSDYTATTDNQCNDIVIEDRTHTPSLQPPDEIDIPDSADNDKPDSVCSDSIDSSFDSEEGLSLCEMRNNIEQWLTLEMSKKEMAEVEVSEEESEEEISDIEISEEVISEKGTSEEEISGIEESAEEMSGKETSEEEKSDEEMSGIGISEEVISGKEISEEVISGKETSEEEMSEEEISEEEMLEALAQEQEAEDIRRKPHTKTPRKTDEHASGSQKNITVKKTSNTACQRIYDKRNYCFYCEKPYAKIARHLTQKHSKEFEVAKALVQRKGSAKRNLLLTKVRNMGNYKHNSSVLSSGKGMIIPKRQAIVHSTATDYLPCKFCFAMYVKTDLWRHFKRCKLKVKDDLPKKRRIQASCALLLPIDCTVSMGLKKVVIHMVNDPVTQVVKSDPLILALGERMFLKNGEVPRHQADIRNKMRELARLLMAARRIDKKIVTLKDLINPGKFKTVLKAVKNMAGFDSSTNRFTVPSTALKLRHSLMKVSSILQGEAIRQQSDSLKSRAENFSKLIEHEWTAPRPLKVS